MYVDASLQKGDLSREKKKEKRGIKKIVNWMNLKVMDL